MPQRQRGCLEAAEREGRLCQAGFFPHPSFDRDHRRGGGGRGNMAPSERGVKSIPEFGDHGGRCLCRSLPKGRGGARWCRPDSHSFYSSM